MSTKAMLFCVEREDMVFCQSCGTEVGDAQYCPQCGSHVPRVPYTVGEKGKVSTSRRRRDAIAILVLVVIVTSMIGLFVWTTPREEPEPLPTHGTLAFYIYNEDAYGNGFNVYLKGEGVPNAIGDWDRTTCGDDHVDCFYTGGLDFFGGTAMLHSDSSLIMYVDLPFGNYDYEIEVNSEVEARGSVYLTEEAHQKSVSFHYDG